MPIDQVSTILNAIFELKTELGKNTEKTNSVHENITALNREFKESNSKLNGRFEAHHQLIEMRAKDNQDFAKREVNLLRQEFNTELSKKKVEETTIVTSKIGAKTTIGVALIGAVSGLLALIFK